MVETYNQYKGRGFEIIAVAMRYDPPNYVANFVQTWQLPFPVVLDVDGAHARAFGNVQVTPTSFVNVTKWTRTHTNNLLLEQLEVGEHSFSYDSSSLDTPSLAANVCSGPDGGSIDYDRPADSGTVVVSNTDEGRQIAVHTETLLDETSGETEVSDTTFVIGAAR